MISLARITLGGPLPAHDFQIALDSRDPILNAATVRFQLRFAFTTAHADSALLPRQVTPEPRQPRQQMLQLRQFNLQLAFFSASTLGENIENQRSPIQNLAIKHSLQIAALGRRKFIVENHRIHIRAPAMLGKFISFALADERRRTRRSQFLQAIPDHLASGRCCQFGKLL
jgi:hypothetical protein